MKKRSSEELLQLARPILHPYLGGHPWSKSIFVSLVETAKLFSPTKAKQVAIVICLEEGLYHSTAEHFALACRNLAILRKYYKDDFKKAINEA